MNKFTNAFEIKTSLPRKRPGGGHNRNYSNILINLRFNCVMDSNLKFGLFGYISLYSGWFSVI